MIIIMICLFTYHRHCHGQEYCDHNYYFGIISISHLHHQCYHDHNDNVHGLSTYHRHCRGKEL
jgi:hypothetical protein